jgi:hypothetical protein
MDDNRGGYGRFYSSSAGKADDTEHGTSLELSAVQQVV